MIRRKLDIKGQRIDLYTPSLLIVTAFLLFFPLSIFANPTSPQSPIQLHTLLSLNDELWNLSAEQLTSRNKELDLSPVSQRTGSTLRSTNSRLEFLQLRVWETLFEFDQGTLHELILSLYNRGDSGDINEKEFSAKLSSIDENLSSWTGKTGIPLKKQERGAAAVLHKKVWIKEPHRISLDWSYTGTHRNEGVRVGFRPEYIRVHISPFNPRNRPRAGFAQMEVNQAKLLTALDLKAHVSTSPNGDIIVDGIPMVDQGEKGYCAAAVAERVLRYFGRNIDQHEIAQIADTTPDRGTNPDVMLSALRQIGNELKVNVESIEDFDIDDWTRLIQDYNRVARRKKQPPIDERLRFVSVAHLYHEMDTELLEQARTKDEARVSNFGDHVRKHVTSGVPLAWSVIVGKVDETPAIKGFGGHMRLIIGYNEKTTEVIYSDTWGQGHEIKRMPVNQAWTITTGLYRILPLNIRI